MEKKDELIKIFSKNIREILTRVAVDFDEVQEIRLRVAAPLLMVYKNEEYYISRLGQLSRDCLLYTSRQTASSQSEEGKQYDHTSLI